MRPCPDVGGKRPRRPSCLRHRSRTGRRHDVLSADQLRRSLLSCDTPDFATSYSGDLTGTISTDFRWVINCNSGVIDGQGAETFTGSVARVGSGTLRWETKFHAAFDCNVQTLSNLHGTGTISSGSGALAGLRGTLIFTDQKYAGILLNHQVQHPLQHCRKHDVRRPSA